MNASYSLVIIAVVALILTVNSIWANQHNVKNAVANPSSIQQNLK